MVLLCHLLNRYYTLSMSPYFFTAEAEVHSRDGRLGSTRAIIRFSEDATTGVTAFELVPKESTNAQCSIKAEPTNRTFFVARRLEELQEQNGRGGFHVAIRVGTNGEDGNDDFLLFIKIFGGHVLGQAFITILQTSQAIVKPFDHLYPVDVSFVGKNRMINDNDGFKASTLRIYRSNDTMILHVESDTGNTIYVGKLSGLKMEIGELQPDIRNGKKKYKIYFPVPESDLPLLQGYGKKVMVGLQTVGNEEERANAVRLFEACGAEMKSFTRNEQASPFTSIQD